jgi:hypothetical protein
MENIVNTIIPSKKLFFKPNVPVNFPKGTEKIAIDRRKLAAIQFCSTPLTRFPWISAKEIEIWGKATEIDEVAKATKNDENTDASKIQFLFSTPLRLVS